MRIIVSDTMKSKPNPEFRAFLQMIGNCIKKDTLQSMRSIVLGNIDPSFHQIRFCFYYTHFMTFYIKEIHFFYRHSRHHVF